LFRCEELSTETSAYRFQFLLGSFTRLLWKLCSVPPCHDPDTFAFHPVEKPIGGDNNFPKGKIRKLRQRSAGLGKSPESRENFFGFMPKIDRCFWILPVNAGDCSQKLRASRRREKDLQSFISFSKESASARTASRLWPLPSSISRSPRASNRSNSSSCWVCS